MGDSNNPMQEVQEMFIEEARPMLAELESLFLELESGSRSADRELMDRIFRLAHNLKGSAAAVGFEHFATLCHGIEDVFSSMKGGTLPVTRERCGVVLRAIDVARSILDSLLSNPSADRAPVETLERLHEANSPEFDRSHAASTTEAPAQASSEPQPETTAPAAASGAVEERSIRVTTRKLDSLLNLVGELVVNQSMMISHRIKGTIESDHGLQTLRYIEKIVGELQTLSMTLRMVPIKPLFQKMTRIIRDVSVALDKDIHLMLDGEHVELDKIVLEQMTDPLTHIVRNAADHGIEDAETRKAAGKSPGGTVLISARQRDDMIQIVVRDDGKGLDRTKLAAKAVEKGLISPERAAGLSEEEAYSLIFLPGFSTKDQVTDLSGRGVGMDVVQRAIRELKGNIRIFSQPGKGTAFEISLPLSLSIIPGLVVNADGRSYVIPISQLVEIVELHKYSIRTSTQRGRMLDLRGEVIPVHHLGSLLHRNGIGEAAKSAASREYQPGVVIAQQGRKVTYEVDEVVGQQQIVIKKLGPEFHALPGILGGAVLSNGEPSMILDLAGLLDALSPTGAPTLHSSPKGERPNAAA